MRLWRLATLLLAAVVLPLCAHAQETRAESIEKQRAEKATQLKAYVPTRLEQMLLNSEQRNLIARLAPHNGFYLQYGYSHKPVGSGAGLSAGWRHDLFDRNARLVLEAGESLRAYGRLRADFFLPRLLDEKLEIGVEGVYTYEPQQDFFGLGLESSENNRTDFLYEAPSVEGRALVKPRKWLNAGVRFGWTDASIERGKDERFRSTDEVFTVADAPGLLQQPTFLYNDLSGTIDTRDQPGNARSGGYYGVLWRHYGDSDLNRFSFDRVDLDLQQFIPIFDKKRVIALRARLMTTTAATGQEVPFYFQPTLGGGDSLRSVGDYRYRDRNVFSGNAEYRWEAFSGLDMALFSDFGTVAPRLSDLRFSDLLGAYGIGFRFNTYKAVFFRFDVAGGGNDGVHLFIKFSKAF
jgi:Omp85 superfamily domain